ncbi:MAG: VOC family protein [Lactococcus cremoris]
MNVCNMIYVENVTKVVSFWLSIGFVEIDRQGEEDALTVTVAPSIKDSSQLQFWKKSYIEQIAPEVANNRPSLLFVVEDIKMWHEKLEKYSENVSPITEYQEMVNFSFTDPEGSYFAFASTLFPLTERNE